MRSVFCMAVVLGLTVPVSAAAPSRDNTVTPEEVAAGWFLLFDGQTIAHWRIDGEYEIKDGVLWLGGSTLTRAYPEAEYGTGFDLRFEYLMDAPSPSGVAARFEYRGVMSSSYMTMYMHGAQGDWRGAYYRGTRKALNSRFGVEICEWSLANEQPGPGSVYSAERGVQAFWFETPPGRKLALRNIKLSGAALGTSDRSIDTGRLWLLGLSLGVFMVGGLVWLRRRQQPTQAELGDAVSSR